MNLYISIIFQANHNYYSLHYFQVRISLLGGRVSLQVDAAMSSKTSNVSSTVSHSSASKTPNRVIAKDVASCTYFCCDRCATLIVRVGGNALAPKTGSTHYHAQIGQFHTKQSEWAISMAIQFCNTPLIKITSNI